MEANAIGILFTNNLEIDENVEVKVDSNPTTFILNIIKECLQHPNILANSSPTTFVFNNTKIKLFSTTNILVASISNFAPSTTKLQQLIKKVNTYIDFKNT
jgi:hypothetical protein